LLLLLVQPAVPLFFLFFHRILIDDVRDIKQLLSFEWENSKTLRLE
jgi:hypothetical protein